MSESTVTNQALPPHECWHRLRTGTIGRLVTVVNGRPDIFPVNYLVDDDHIVIKTSEGTKLAGAIASDEVLFEVDEADESTATGWSVVVRGVAREPRRLEDVMHDDGLGLQPWARPDQKRRFIEIIPAKISGRVVGNP